MISTGESQNKAGNYSAALDNFNKVLSKCDAYDAKEKGYAGKAGALNGLHQYNDALTAANAGLKINASSLDNLLEKGNAEMGLGMMDEARADFSNILNLTAKNRNTAQRATIFAKVAEAETKQQMYSDALQHIGSAIDADGTNAGFYGQRAAILIGMYEKKYGTTDAATLRKKISASDKQALCGAIQTAQSKGFRDVKVDLVQATVCQ
jgi:tetratricopeptide (TPR) repeat protein